MAHVFFQGSPNFVLSVFAFAVEGWLFYSAVNSVIPQIILHLGFEDDSWIIGLRQLSVSVTAAVMSILITYVVPLRRERRISRVWSWTKNRATDLSSGSTRLDTRT